MKKNNVIFILSLSLILVVLWIGYSIYSSIFVQKYTVDDPNLNKYLEPVNTQMNLDSLNKLATKGSNIKISRDSLK